MQNMTAFLFLSIERNKGIKYKAQSIISGIGHNILYKFELWTDRKEVRNEEGYNAHV